MISQALQQFCEGKVGLSYIPLGTPGNNGFIESFDNRLRKECLNRNHWTNLLEARPATSAEIGINQPGLQKQVDRISGTGSLDDPSAGQALSPNHAPPSRIFRKESGIVAIADQPLAGTAGMECDHPVGNSSLALAEGGVAMTAIADDVGPILSIETVNTAQSSIWLVSPPMGAKAPRSS